MLVGQTACTPPTTTKYVTLVGTVNYSHCSSSRLRLTPCSMLTCDNTDLASKLVDWDALHRKLFLVRAVRKERYPVEQDLQTLHSSTGMRNLNAADCDLCRTVLARDAECSFGLCRHGSYHPQCLLQPDKSCLSCNGLSLQAGYSKVPGLAMPSVLN